MLVDIVKKTLTLISKFISNSTNLAWCFVFFYKLGVLYFHVTIYQHLIR